MTCCFLVSSPSSFSLTPSLFLSGSVPWLFVTFPWFLHFFLSSLSLFGFVSLWYCSSQFLTVRLSLCESFSLGFRVWGSVPHCDLLTPCSFDFFFLSHCLSFLSLGRSLFPLVSPLFLLSLFLGFCFPVVLFFTSVTAPLSLCESFSLGFRV